MQDGAQTMARKRRPQGAGSVRQLTSGRWQARYRQHDHTLKSAPVTFDTKLDASAWLADYVEGAVIADHKRPDTTLAEYATVWLASRELKPRTRAHYRDLLDDLIEPSLGAVRLSRVSPDKVRAWYGRIDATHPTLRAHAYGLLRTIMATALADELVAANPCRIRGAGSSRTKHQTTVATLPELEVIVAAMPERYRPMVLLAAWCGLRFGELTELRRGDIDALGRVLRVRRGVSRAGGQVFIGDPKSDAGRRDVSIPPHLMPALTAHLSKHVGAEPGALLFPGRNGGSMAPSSLYRVWYPARAAAGRSDLRFHDLRHTGGTLAAATGATLADLMARLGHSTPVAAMVYQHAAAGRDRDIADALSGFAVGNVVPLKRRA
jgi:integrase